MNAGNAPLEQDEVTQNGSSSSSGLPLVSSTASSPFPHLVRQGHQDRRSSAKVLHPNFRRGTSGLNRQKPNLFSKRHLNCSTPKAYQEIDLFTGEIVTKVWHRYDYVTRSWIPVRCRRNSCLDCSIMNGRRIAGAIRLSKPTYVLSLTQVGHGRADINKRIAKFFELLRKTIPTLRYAWAAEANPLETGVHIHSYLHTGDVDLDIPLLAINRACSSALMLN
jgi:hypothetical protein